MRHVISRWAGSCEEKGRSCHHSEFNTCCTYRRTRASPPLRRMRTRDTRVRSSYHRLALGKRLSIPLRDPRAPYGRRTREKRDVPLALISPVRLARLQSDFRKHTPIGDAPMHADDADQQRRRMTCAGMNAAPRAVSDVSN